MLYAPATAGGHVIWAGSSFLGHGTNNRAEYGGAILGLRASAQLPGLVALHCRGDSTLVVRQAAGRWRLREPSLAPFLAELQVAATVLGVPVTWEVRPREENWRADALASDASRRGQYGDVQCLEWSGPEAIMRINSIPIPPYCAESRAAASRRAGHLHCDDALADEGAHAQCRQQLGDVTCGSQAQAEALHNPTTSWDVIDDTDLEHCIASPFGHYDDVPSRFSKAWASAIADVLATIRDADSDAQLDRGLKWLLLLHDILLRMPPRGGRRGRNALGQRFAAWADGDLEKLVQWWRQDRSAVKPRSGRQGPQQNAGSGSSHPHAMRSLCLLSEGEISRALKLLTSEGLGDLTDERIVEQLAAKHPIRKEELPSTLEGYEPFRRLQIDLTETLRHLDVKSGTGPGGCRNSYLKALTQDFSDAKAASALGLLNDFAERFVNADFPPWFYAVFTAVKLAAPIKSQPANATEAPDVRPLGVGECLRRAINSALLEDLKPACASHFWPQQVAIGIPSGISLLIFGVRELLEVLPDWVGQARSEKCIQ